MDPADLAKYEQGFNIIDPDQPDLIAICFTKGYWRCKLASGSLLKMKDGQVRRFSPAEMLRLFGFPGTFRFPEHMELKEIWQLVGNAVDIRAVRHVLQTIPTGQLDLTSDIEVESIQRRRNA